MPKIISSGNPELDSRMGGGIPAETLMLIEGTSGAGKSVLSQQIIWGALQDRNHVSLFTSENSVKSLIRQMQSIDLDVLDFLLLNKFRAYPIKLSRLGAHAPHALFLSMQEEFRQDVIVIDSFTSALSRGVDDADVLGFFEGCQRLCARGQTIIVTLHSGAVNPDLISPIRSMCDAHLQLRAAQDGQRLVKTLEVAKIRGAASVTGAIVGFEVEPGWGMRVIPISKARG
ncbi:MAG: ATPase domain-containing protein [Anaerolineae bacterium]